MIEVHQLLRVGSTIEDPDTRQLVRLEAFTFEGLAVLRKETGVLYRKPLRELQERWA